MTSYLVFDTPADAEARSNQQALAKGCTGDTQYWWSIVVNSGTGQAALAIDDSGDYGPGGLTTDEEAALVNLSPTDPNWFPPPGD